MIWITLGVVAFVGGMSTGLLGMGSSQILTPSLLFLPPLLGIPPFGVQTVTALSLAQVFFGGMSGSTVHRRFGAVDVRLTVWMASSTVGAAMLGGAVARFLPDRLILTIFAVLSTLAGVSLFVRSRGTAAASPEAEAGPVNVPPLSASLMAAGVGFVAAIAGTGGAILLVPLMVRFLKMPLRTVVGSATVITGVAALGGLAGRVLTGPLPFAAMGAVLVGALAGAQVGGYLSQRVPLHLLRLGLAVVIVGSSSRIWLQVLVAR